MLSDACRTFRETFEPGRQEPHRGECPRCAAFADAVELAAGAGLDSPLPTRLRRRLVDVPESALTAPVGPVEQLPLPRGLERRLKALGSSRRGGPPEWVRSVRYAVAASYLLTVVTGAAFGNPATLGQNATNALSRQVEEVLSVAGNEGRERYAELRATARRQYAQTRDSVTKSVTRSLNQIQTTASAIAAQLFGDDAGEPEAEAPAIEDDPADGESATERSTAP